MQARLYYIIYIYYYIILHTYIYICIIPIRWPTPTSSEVQTVQYWNLQGKTPTNVTVESLPSRYGTDHSAGLDRTAVKMTRLSLFSAVRATWIYLNAFLPFMGSIVWFLVWAIGVLRSTRSNGWAGFWTTRWRYSMIFRDAWKSSMPMPGQSDLPIDGNLCFLTVWGRVDICTMMSIDVNRCQLYLWPVARRVLGSQFATSVRCLCCKDDEALALVSRQRSTSPPRTVQLETSKTSIIHCDTAYLIIFDPCGTRPQKMVKVVKRLRLVA